MDINSLFKTVYTYLKYSFICALLGGAAFAQAVSTASLNESALNLAPINPSAARVEASTPPLAVSPVPVNALPESPIQHRFWDTENSALFATVAALNAADFAVTRANLQNGGKELNPVTRIFSGSTAGLAVNFAGETAGVIGLSYYFHKTGHHELERITPMVNIGASSFAVTYDLSHR
jgi:hypothetical protein